MDLLHTYTPPTIIQIIMRNMIKDATRARPDLAWCVILIVSLDDVVLLLASTTVALLSALYPIEIVVPPPLVAKKQKRNNYNFQTETKK